MDILFVSAEVPSRRRPRPYGFIDALARHGHRVTLICGVNPHEGFELNELRALCQRVVAVRHGSLERGRALLQSLPGRLPTVAARGFGADLLTAVRAAAQTGRYEVAHVSGLCASALGYALLNTPAVLDMVECAGLRHERALRASDGFARATPPINLARTRRYEVACLQEYDRVMVATDDDAWALGTLAAEAYGEPPAHLHVVPSAINTTYFAPQSRLRDRTSLLLDLRELRRAEALHALSLVASVLPLVWAERADVRLTVIGPAPMGTAGRLAGDPRVIFTGETSDPRNHLATASIVLAPLTLGTASPHAMFQAMAMGAALLAARPLANAVRAHEGHELLAAETPAEWARAILALLDDPAYAGQLGRAGRQLIEQRYSPAVVAAHLAQVYAAARGEAVAAWRLELGLHRPYGGLAGR